MPQILRQSTQVIVRIGPAVAVGDGFTPVTTLDLSTADEAELLKANTTTTTSIAAATFAAITGCDGWYGLTLTTSLTDTVGCLDVMVNDDSLILPIFARFQVIEEAAYDAIYAASAAGPATPTNITAGTITTATNVTTVNGLAANVITAASMAADASAEIADAVWDEDATGHQTQGTFGQAIGDPAADTNTIFKAVVTDSTGATVGVDVAAVLADTGTDGVVVASIATDAVTAAALAADAVAEIADGVWDEDATGHQTQGTFGQAIGDPVADANTIYGAVVTGAAGATIAADIIAVKAETADILTDTAEIGAAGAGLTAINLPDQTMNITGNITGNLSGSVGSVTGAVGSVTGLTASDVGAIKAKTDSLTFTVAAQVDANIQSVNDVTVTGTGAAGDEWGP